MPVPTKIVIPVQLKSQSRSIYSSYLLKGKHSRWTSLLILPSGRTVGSLKWVPGLESYSGPSQVIRETLKVGIRPEELLVPLCGLQGDLEGP